MGSAVRFVPRLVQNILQLGELLEAKPVVTTITVWDQIVEHTPDPDPDPVPPPENLIDEAAMGLGERGELPGGTSIVDAVTEYVGGGAHADNCVEVRVLR